MTVDVDLDHGTETSLSAFSTVKLLVFILFSHCALWKEVTVHSHTAEWGARFPFFEGRKSV